MFKPLASFHERVVVTTGLTYFEISRFLEFLTFIVLSLAKTGGSVTSSFHRFLGMLDRCHFTTTSN